MPLNDFVNSDENFMPSYDHSPGYVEKSISSAKPYLPEWDVCIGSLPLTTNNNNKCQDLLCRPLLTYLTSDFEVEPQCLQIQPEEFQKIYPESLIQQCHKIGEGLYGEVFLFRNSSGGTTVMKIIPVEGILKVNGEHQKTFKEAISEVFIAKELSSLADNERINQTENFLQVNNIRYVQGRYPVGLIELWNLYKDNRGSINDCPEIFDDNQLYIVLETTYGGCDMESFIFEHAAQAFSMLLQVAFAIAIAEEELQFEHRDLHWGNILLSRVPLNEKITFKLRGKEIRVGSYGIKATIIDFTTSRITVGDVPIYTDLGKDCGIFNGSGDYQYDIYRMMQKKNGNDWSAFDPYSNVLWLSYILDKALTALNYLDSSTKLHRKYMNKLKKINLDILGHDSVMEFILNLFDNNNFV